MFCNQPPSIWVFRKPRRGLRLVAKFITQAKFGLLAYRKDRFLKSRFPAELFILSQIGLSKPIKVYAGIKLDWLAGNGREFLA